MAYSGGTGTICVTETDYTTFEVQPPSRDYDYLERAQYDYFTRFGNPIPGRQLGNLLNQVGFENVRSRPIGFHFCRGSDPSGLREHVRYVIGFLEPGLGELVTALGCDRTRLEAGIEHLRSVPEYADGSMTQIVYRAHANAPQESST